MASDVIAVCCADLHLSHAAPVARSAEPDWYEAMGRPLRQLRELQRKYEVPVLCAGDVFDRWSACPELVNWVMENLPDQFCSVAGQHDLPYHGIEDVRRSAYDTLVRSGRIHPVGTWTAVGGTDAIGVHWGCSVPLLSGDGLNLIVLHRYVWAGKAKHPEAPREQHLSQYEKLLKGYDVAVFGDNHQAFIGKAGGCVVLNCGCLIPRRSTERGKSSVGLVYEDGSAKLVWLDTSEDKWVDVSEETEAEGPSDLAGFLDELRGLQNDPLDFASALRRYADSVEDAEVGRLLIQSLEGE